MVLGEVSAYNKCGVCDSATPPSAVHATNNLYEAKMWSQLFYDSIVLFDTDSRRRITSAGYPNPARDFLGMNNELFADLRQLSDAHGLGIPGLRGLDSPVLIDVQFGEPPPSGQPLSRVIDKIFYGT
jgi:hypothetical protein